MSKPRLRFPALLKAKREEAGLSREALADLLAKTPRAIAAWETGQNGVTLAELHVLADVLKLTPDDLAEAIRPAGDDIAAEAS